MNTLRSSTLRNWAVLLGLASILLAVDQGSKWLVRQNLAVGEAWAPIPALSKVFTFTHVQNTGVSFGQLPGLGWVFMVANFVVVVGILVYYSRIPAGQWLLRIALALVLAGALGNVIDRLRTAFLYAEKADTVFSALSRAHVTDFFDIKIWPVWNVADMCVVGGTAILAWVMWQAERKEAARQAVSKDQ